MSFDSLGLSDDLVANVTAKGYTVPTPIQKQAIPAVIAGRDILAGAQTGTGKTAAFALPIIQELVGKSRSAQGQRRLRCLVITPTRELAAQVGESFEQYSRGTGLQTSVIFGGVGQNPQVSSVRRGIDILVATPGRLLDLNQQGFCPLNTVEILVLDEADRMLDMGFIHDIRKILKELPSKRQNLLFSATYTEEIRKLASSILVNPVLIDVAPRNAAAEQVVQRAYSVSKGMKRALLSQLIRDSSWYQVLVFTRTKHGANRLSKQLASDGIPSAPIHGNKSQAARTKALASFKKGDLQALVATDIAARGLDIKELACVVNYELPNVPEDYVHRIGRTGRAGMEGLAISLFCDEEEGYLRDIEKLLRKPVAREVFKGEIQILNTDHPSEDDDRRGGRETDRVKRQRHGGLSRKNAAAPAPSNQREGGGRDDGAPRSGNQRPGFLRKGGPKSGNPKNGGWNSPGNVKQAPRNEQEKPFESGRRGSPEGTGAPGRPSGPGGSGRQGSLGRTGGAGINVSRRGSGSSGDGRKTDTVKDSINSVTGRDERPSAGNRRRGRER